MRQAFVGALKYLLTVVDTSYHKQMIAPCYRNIDYAHIHLSFYQYFDRLIIILLFNIR